MIDFEPLSARIIGASFRVHNSLGPGHLESVYRNALAIELRKEGLKVLIEDRIVVHYEKTPVGHCQADLLVEHQIVVECKAKICIMPGHEMRLAAYLNCSPYEVGLVLNFGATRVEIKRVLRGKEDKHGGAVA